MTSRHIVAIAAIALASVVPAYAAPPSTIYVTTGQGGQILAITIDPTTAVQVGPAQPLLTSGATLGDLTLRSDGSLVYATTTEVRQLLNGQDSSFANIAGANELRFSAYNCLFFNSAGGANSTGCGNTGSPSGSGGKGLAFNVFGQLLAISGNTVIRIPVNAQGNKGTPVVFVSGGLTSPSGIAVASGKGTNNLGRSDFVVADGRFVRLYDGKTGALKDAAYATVPPSQTINYADFDADDRLWITTQKTPDASPTPNGRVFRIDSAGAICDDVDAINCRLAALLPTSQNSYFPAVGLALGPSSRVLTQGIIPTVPNGVQTFELDFGSSLLEFKVVVVAECQLRVAARTLLAPDATALVNNPVYSLNPYLGSGGLPTIYTIDAISDSGVVDASACVEVTPTSKPVVLIGALTSTESNPRLLRCDPACSEAEFLAWYHTGPIDNDGEGGGRGDGFSDWLLVDKAVATNPADQIQFCGFETPLKADGSYLANPGSTFPVRPQFSAPGRTCASKVFLQDPNAKFLISLTQISPTHDPKPFIGPGGGPAIATRIGTRYEFPLTLKNPDGTNFPAGTYEITVTDVTPSGTRLVTPPSIRFRIRVVTP